GIGKEIAFAFAEAGAKGVLCADIKDDAATKIAKESKGLAASPKFEAVGVAVDIANAHSVQSMVDVALKKFGRIDCLVNAAGVPVVPFHMTSEEDFRRVFGVNARGSFLLSKAIIHVVSAMAFGAGPCKVLYITAQHALLGITRASGKLSKHDSTTTQW
ncbi:NAD(P)-binding protein, partial [Amniculicola lignicola CBS 123094]